MHTGLIDLTTDECYQRLRKAHLGRVALSVDALPLVLPVHFVMLGPDPVFRTEQGAKLQAASNGNILCLEIDEADPEFHTGWSVVVVGPGELLTDPEDLAAAQRLP